MIHVGQSEFDQAEIENVLDALSHNWVTMGRYVEHFERAFADFVGTKHAIAVSNGTAALHLALVALGIGAGDEVIVPATTFIATANAVTYTGATPVIVDVDPKTWNISIDEIEKKITNRTKAVIPVHLYGVPAQMFALMQDIYDATGCPIIEDCAEALGAYSHGQHVGTFGDVGTFSFYGNKTITTGEGGMVVTDDDDIAEMARLYRGQGQSNRRYWHEVVGFNYRMTDLQGALGVGQMAKLKRFLQARHSLMQVYLDNLPTDGLTVQKLNDHDIHGCWAMAVLFNSVSDRVRIQNQLMIEGIETRPIFYPLNEMPPYRDGNLNAVSMKLSAQGLVLPLHTGMSANDVKRICELISEVIHVHQQTA